MELTFWEFVRERVSIHDRKVSGQPWPWTDNEILRRYYFCNIYREQDKTTAWFRQNIRGPLTASDRVIFATIIFRWFNRIETGEVLHKAGLLLKWDSKRAKELLSAAHPVCTGAYIIKTPDNMTKLEGVCWCIDKMWNQQQTVIDLVKTYPNSLELQWVALQGWPFMGPFMAYEVVTDLRHTNIGRYAHDINTWANAGPGAKRGLQYVYPGVVSPRLSLMQKLFSEASAEGFDMEMRDVEHALCEYSKYRQACEGKRLKRLYRNGTGS